MKLYHIYNTETFQVTALLSETKPLNSINQVANGQLRPIYDVENDCIIEGATQQEIETYNKIKELEKKQEQHNELLKTDWYFTRFIEKGIAVPKEIIKQRELIRNT